MKQAFSCLAAVFRTPQFYDKGCKLMPNLTAGPSFSTTLTERRPEKDFGSGKVGYKSGWIDFTSRKRQRVRKSRITARDCRLDGGGHLWCS